MTDKIIPEAVIVAVYWDNSSKELAPLTVTQGLYYSGANLGVSDASATVPGKVELATPAEALAGTDTVRAVTPQGLIQAVNSKVAASSLSGTYAARPAANTVQVGTLYYCTNVPEAYRSSGTAWQVVQSGGNMLGFATGAGQSTQSTGFVAVTGCTATFVAGVRPVKIEFQCESATSIAEAIATYQIRLGAGVLAQAVSRGIGADEWRTLQKFAVIDSFTPGQTYTVNVMMSSSYNLSWARVQTPQLLVTTL